MDARLSKLVYHDYLVRPNLQQRRLYAIPEPVLWLGWRGALFLAGLAGIEPELPKRVNENWLRKLERRLREEGLGWQREPRWSQLAHDLAVVDFRLEVENALSVTPHLTLEAWFPESEFRSQMDVVEFSYGEQTGKSKKGRKGVRPDGYFVVIDERRRARGEPARARFLLEMDFATHPHDRFGKYKLAAGLAYIRSQAYRDRFGSQSGRWLVICLKRGRMHNLKRLAEGLLGEDANHFFFATLEDVLAEDCLTGPMWYQGGNAAPVSLLSAR